MSKQEQSFSLTIDGLPVTAGSGMTVLQAARQAGISIPTLCHHPQLSPFGGCRLCIVQIEGVPRPVTACTTPVSGGMVVTTDSSEISALRRTVLELILSDHPNDCMVCEAAGACDLQDLAYQFGLRDNPYPGERRLYEKRDANPFIERDMEKCIACGRCVKACDEIQGVGAINFTYRGFKTKICPPFERDLDCEFCGQCVQFCPTGALVGKQWDRAGRTLGVRPVKTVCGYCGVGCEVNIHVAGNRIVKVTVPDDAWNDGLLCVKGRFGYSFVQHHDRLTVPLVRRNGELAPASWDEALAVIANKLKQIRSAAGPDAIGGISSARCTNEENYAFQKFMRAIIGTNNVDHCARLCHAPTVAGLASIFGSGSMTNSIDEISGSEVLLLVGTNTKETHPVVANRMIEAKRRGAKIILIDPRRIPMARFADIHLRLRPGTNVALLKALAHVIVEEDLIDKEFIAEQTTGVESYLASLKAYAPEAVAGITGVPAEHIRAAARAYGSSRKAGIYYAMGITQHQSGTDNVRALAYLALLTGNIGRPHTGINPLRGQNNVQGACDAGCLPNVLPGYQKVGIPDNVEKFEQSWKTRLSAAPGMTMTEMIPAAASGVLKALYIMGENPVLTDPNASHTLLALKNLEFLVVQDIFLTETAELAHVVLPTACCYEKDGTFTNTERKVQRVRKAVEPPGKARDDLSILLDLTTAMGSKLGFTTPSEALQEFAALWEAMSGISYQRLEKGGLHWPCLDESHPGIKVRHAKGFRKGHAVFTPVEYRPAAEQVDPDFPFLLTTGRNLFHHHGGSMTRRVHPIELHAGRPYIEMNPEDAELMGIHTGDILRITSRRGSITVGALINRSVTPSVVFLPMHYREAAANILTSDSCDPVTKTPEFKVCAVKISTAETRAPKAEKLS
ncbi:MAG TPA: formate dehydrogenase subunit alpha [Dissulfurispiraceae bacterium]|nr:formate dehydrogenase subunit alpha [Dissulfurispiraceae bacterium]